MQVNSVSSNNVSNKTSFGSKKADKDANNVAAMMILANASDSDLKKLAYMQAGQNVNDKKHKAISNLIWYSVPFAAGLGAAIAPKLARVSRLGAFVGTALGWVGTLAAIDVTLAAKNKLDKTSKTSREFSKNHPILSAVGTVAATVGLLFLGNKGIQKVAGKVLTEARLERITKSKLHLAEKLDNSKILNKTAKLLQKVPSVVKNFARGVIDWSPMLLIVSHITHSINHDRAKIAETVKVYDDLKTEQQNVREAFEKIAEEQVADEQIAEE